MNLIGLLLLLAFLYHQERRHGRRALAQRVRLARPQPGYRMSTPEREYADALSGIRRRGTDQNVIVDFEAHRARA